MPRKPSPKRTNWKRVADQLAGDVNAVAKDYNDAITKLKAAEQRIAELEAEREKFDDKIWEYQQEILGLREKVRPTLWQRFKAWRQG